MVTIMFIPPGETEVVKIEVRVNYHLESATAGLWNLDNNQVMLSPAMFNQFRACKTQKEQGAFFSQLHKISSTQIQ